MLECGGMKKTDEHTYYSVSIPAIEQHTVSSTSHNQSVDHDDSHFDVCVVKQAQ